jgi:ABC-2 type transport system permease protein
MNVPALLTAELRRTLSLMRRYPVNTVSTVIVLWMFFIGLVFGSRAIAGAAGPASAAATGSSLVGFLIWFYAIAAIMGIAGDVWGESQTGTIEQVYLSPFGPPLIFVTRQVAGLVMTTIQIVCIALLTVLVTRVSVHWKLDQMIPILLIMMFGLYGLGLIFGGLALIFKQIGNLLMILQFALLFVTMTPIDKLHGPPRVAAAFFPLSQGAGLLRGIASGAESIGGQWTSGHLPYLILCSAVYLIAGVLIYGRLDSIARRRGTIGQY